MKCYLNAVSINNNFFSGYIKKIYITSITGMLNIYPGHTALLSMTKPGLLCIFPERGNKKIFFYISEGILEVQPILINLVLDRVILGTDLNYTHLINKKKSLMNIIKKNNSRNNIDLNKKLFYINAKLYVIKIMNNIIG